MTEEIRSSPTDDGADSPLDEIVDDLLPDELDWRRLARSYPIPALVVAAAGGYLIGREHGPSLLAALRDFVTGEVSGNIQSLLDGSNRA